MSLEKLRGFNKLLPEDRDILLRYIEKNKISEDFLAQSKCRISNSGNIVLEDDTGEMIVINKTIIKQQRLREKEMETFAERIRQKCSDKEFLKTIYPVDGGIERIAVGFPNSAYGSVSFTPVLFPNNKEIRRTLTLVQDSCMYLSEDDLIEKIKKHPFIVEYAADRQEKVFDAVRTAYKKEGNRIKEFAKRIKTCNRLFENALSEDEYAEIYQIEIQNTTPSIKLKAGGNCQVVYSGIRFDYDLIKDSAQISRKIGTIMWHTELIFSNKTVLEKLIAEVEKRRGAWEELKLNCSYGKKAEPVLSFTVSARTSNEQTYTSDAYELNDSNVKTCMKEVDNAGERFEKEANQKLKQEENALKKAGLYGNMLVDDIILLLKKNPDYITENVIVKILKGTKITSTYEYNYAGIYGKYLGIDEDEIRTIFENLSDRDYIGYKSVKGAYGRYDIVKLTKKEFPFHKAAEFAGTSQLGKYTDYDWKALLSMETVPSTIDWQQIMEVFERPSVIFGCRTEMERLFSKAPEIVKYYLKAMGKTETKSWMKKYYKLMEKA